MYVVLLISSGFVHLLLWFCLIGKREEGSVPRRTQAVVELGNVRLVNLSLNGQGVGVDFLSHLGRDAGDGAYSGRHLQRVEVTVFARPDTRGEGIFGKTNKV